MKPRAEEDEPKYKIQFGDHNQFKTWCRVSLQCKDICSIIITEARIRREHEQKKERRKSD